MMITAVFKLINCKIELDLLEPRNVENEYLFETENQMNEIVLGLLVGLQLRVRGASHGLGHALLRVRAFAHSFVSVGATHVAVLVL